MTIILLFPLTEAITSRFVYFGFRYARAMNCKYRFILLLCLASLLLVRTSAAEAITDDDAPSQCASDKSNEAAKSCPATNRPSPLSEPTGIAEGNDEAAKAGSRENEDKQTGFRSWAQLYHWALNATKQVSNGEEGGVVVSRGEIPGKGRKEMRVEKFDGETEVMKSALAILSDDRKQKQEKKGKEESIEKGTGSAGKSDENAIKADGENQKVMEALETLSELCHSLNHGIDLLTMGGLQLLSSYLDDSTTAMEVHHKVLGVLGVCTRNNEKVATRLIEAKLLDRIFELSEIPQLRARGLSIGGAVVGVLGGSVMEGKADAVMKVVKDGLNGNQNEKEQKRGVLRALHLMEDLVRTEEEKDVWKKRFSSESIKGTLGRLVQSDQGDVKDTAQNFAKMLQ